MKSFLFSLFIALALVQPRAGGAAELPGQGAPPFQRAVERWLDGDDMAALATLAGLARDGNSAARVLLAQIDRVEIVPSRALEALGPAGRRDLFRAPLAQRYVAPSWLLVEANTGNELARLLLEARGPAPRPALIAELVAAGEPQATDHPTRMVALYGTDEQRARLLADGLALEELRPFVAFMSGIPEPRGNGLAALRRIADAPQASADDPETHDMASLLALGYGYGPIDPENRWFTPVADWLLNDPATAPLAGLCRAVCPAAEVPACAVTAMALTGGYYEVIRLDSPLESVIPQETFLQSRKARAMALRRIALTRDQTNEVLASIPDIAENSQCLAVLVSRERTGG